MHDVWTPLPSPTPQQIDRAARDLLHIAELEPLRRGGVTFARSDLALLAWHDPELGFDWEGDLGEVPVSLKDLPIDHDEVATEVQPDLQFRQNLARCRLAISQAVDRRDQDIVLMREALEGRN